MILYLDTSSLLKLYVEEEHSVNVRQWVSESRVVATSVVAYPEAMAAFARRARDGSLVEADCQRVVTGFQAEWEGGFLAVAVAERAAGDLAWRQGLRGFDAVHLAAALELRDHDPALSVGFSSFDDRLNSAAVAEGLNVLAPGAL